MNFKNGISLVVLMILTVKCTYGQNCSIVAAPNKTVSYENKGLIGRVYDSLINDYSGHTTVYLVNNFSQTGRIYGYLVSFDSTDSFVSAVFLTSDSVICRKSSLAINAKNQLPKDNSENNFFIGTSGDAVVHMQSILLIANKQRNSWIEYDNVDGNGRSCIKKMVCSLYLKYAVAFLEDVFKDLSGYPESVNQ